MATLPPIPTASVIIATSVNKGLLRKIRNPYRMS
jgi:hypothetical protein